MEINQNAPEMKPQLGLFKYIDGSHSLQEYSRKRYKNLSKLKVIKSSNQKHMRPTSILQKLSVSTKGLDLSQYGLLEKYSRSQIKLVAKKFLKITIFSSSQNKKGSKSFLFILIMLRKAKNLKYLCLKSVSGHASVNLLLNLISQCKLKRIELIPISSPQFDPTKLFNYLICLPSTIEELCLSWKDPTEMKWSPSVRHLDNLQKLELGMPLDIKTFMGLIKSIQDPSKLKTLRFQLERYQTEGFDVSKIQVFLENCINLEELDIQTDLDVYPRHISLTKLRKLAIESNFGLLGITLFIQQQKESLESLSLASKLCYTANLRDELFKALKLLKRLKRLKLNVTFEPPSLSVLDYAKLIETLEDLEEVDFLGVLFLFEEDSFGRFCGALGKRCGTLKSLKVSFNNWSFNQKTLSFFCETLKLLSQLKHLTFKDLRIEDASFYDELREIVCFKNPNLNEVLLKNVKRQGFEAFRENLLQMLRDIVSKPKMKQFCYVEDENHGLAL